MIPQFVPYWGEKERDAVLDVLQSDYLNEHRQVRKFEEAFAQFVGARHCVAVTSGTVALYCAIHAAGYKEADVPAHDGIFAFNALLAAGATPSVRDVDDRGLLASSGRRGITVHANGRIAGQVPLIEDCSQAITHHTKDHISTYSFASTKHITTGGQGGAVCCDDQETFEGLIRLKDHGRTDRQLLRPMSDNYDKWGMNYKFTEIQAAFGLAQLSGLPGRLTRLGEIDGIYRDMLGNRVRFDDVRPGWYADAFVPDAAALCTRLKENGIHCRQYPRPLHMQKVAAPYVRDTAFCNAEERYKTGFYLPSTTNLEDEDIKDIVGGIVCAISEL